MKIMLEKKEKNWKWLWILTICSTLLLTSACGSTGLRSTETGQNSEAAIQDGTGEQSSAGDLSGDQTLIDGTYQVEVTLSGGSGRAAVTSPCTLTVSGGRMIARIEWSSPNYDYMLVDGEKYLPVNTEGNSVFEIPVAALDQELPVTADTTAMSKPHEVEYTLTFHRNTDGELPQKEGQTGNDEAVDREQLQNAGQMKNGENDSEILKGDPQISSALTYTGSLSLTYAREFRVDEYEGGYRLLTTRDEKRMLIVPEGRDAPSDLPEDVQVLQQPVKDIYIAASAVMDFFAGLDENLSCVRYSSLTEDSWGIEEARKAMAEGSIKYAGKYSVPDYEQLLSGGCRLAVENTMIFHTPEIKEQLEAVGIPVLIDYSSYETHPLGRVEWVKFYGALLSREEEAEAIFEEQEGILKRVTEEMATQETAPTVAFFYINASGGVNVRKSTDYVPAMIALAGGSYIPESTGENSDGRASINMQMEAFYQQAKDADYLIYNSTIEGEVHSLQELCDKDEVLKDFKAVKEGRVYCTTGDLYQRSLSAGVFIEDVHRMLTGETDLQFMYPLS